MDWFGLAKEICYPKETVMSECHCCGGSYPDADMADWTICRSCMARQMPADTYIDSLGICWSPEDVQEAGGVEEIEKMCRESKVI